jgi:lysophospholipase L1-like esterase
MKRLVALFTAVLMLGLACSCGGAGDTSAISEEQASSEESVSLCEVSSADASSSGPRVINIMPLGDSLTQGGEIWSTHEEIDSAYRNYLSGMLTDAGYNFKFCGIRTSHNTMITDGKSNHAGYGGATVASLTEYLEKSNFYKPDIVLLMVGRNDYTSGADAQKIFADYDKLIDRIFEYFPNTHLVCAGIPPMRMYNYARELNEKDKAQTEFNPQMYDYIAQKAAAGIKISYVDMSAGCSGITWSDYYCEGDDRSAIEGTPYGRQSDFVHPISSGWEKIAKVWFDGIKDIMDELSAQ